MKNVFNREDALNEVIFENKNKFYGAYALRKEQNNRLLWALMLAAGFFIVPFFMAFVLTGKPLILPDTDLGNEPGILPYVEIPVVIPKDIPKVNKIKHPETPKSTSGNMVASNDKDDKVEQTNDQQIISNNPNPNGSDSASTVADFKGTITVEKPNDKDPVLIPDNMPEFDNLNAYITGILRYPQIAKDEGIQGKVYISFIVETDGTVSDVKAMNKIGGGCELEAIRVVSTMKKWKPGIFKGKPRRVPVTLPIWFKLE